MTLTATERLETSPEAVAHNDYWLWWEQALRPTATQASEERDFNRTRAQLAGIGVVRSVRGLIEAGWLLPCL